MPHILIIDSETPVADELSGALEGLGATAHVSGDGTEGVEYAKSNAPDLIVLCVELTRGSGYSVCNKLKKDSQLATIPLILTSAQATEETFEQHKKLRTRAEAYLKKPFEADEIIAMMRDYVELGGSAAPAQAEAEVEIDADYDTEFEVGGDEVSPDAEVELEVDAAPEVSEEQFNYGQTVMMTVPQSNEAPARRPTQTVVNEAEGETLRSENRQLRQKVQRLERQLQDKEVEYNDRLLAESGRAREGLDAKNRLGQLERELQKYQQLADRAQAEADQYEGKMRELQTQIKNLEQERQVLSDKLGQVVEKVKSLASERDSLRNQIDGLEGERMATSEQEETQRKMREKARKAVDIAMQLINETGLVH